LANSIGGCELKTKCIAIILVNDSNDDGNVSRIFIALSTFCAKLTIFPLSARWPIVPPLLVYHNLTNMVEQQ
jgi:hypothetical protein